MTRVLVCGTRQYIPEEFFFRKMDLLLRGVKSPVIVSGHAYGADKLGELYAFHHRLIVDVFIPDWDRNPRSAGHIRNRQMVDTLDLMSGDFVIAVWDGKSKGTRGAIDCALKKGIKVKFVHYCHQWQIMVDQPMLHITGKFHGYCHMMSKTGDLEELHAFAKKLGLKRDWFQNHPTHPHYDISQIKRETAIQLGAEPVTSREMTLRLRDALGIKKVFYG